MTARIFVLIGALLAAPVAGVAGQADTTKQEAAALARFDARVAEYVTLHRRLEGPVPPQQLSGDMRVVRAAMDTLVANVVAAMRSITVERGYDPREFTLIPFGGMGPTTACKVAVDLARAYHPVAGLAISGGNPVLGSGAASGRLGSFSVTL